MSIDISIKYARLPNDLVYFYQQWIPKDPLGLVVFVHGFGDHCSRYDAFIKATVDAGLACATYDQRGHGRTGGRRGHIDRFEDLVDDLDSFAHFSMTKVPEGTPLFVVGHSLGALVAIHYSITHAQPVAGIVSLAGAFAPVLRIPKWKGTMASKLRNILPKLSIDNGIRRQDLTRDLEELEALAADGLYHNRITIGAGREIANKLSLLGGIPQRVYEPMLVMAGTADSVCDPGASKWFADRLASVDKKYESYDGMYHDLLHDTGRERVLEDVTGWIAERARGVRSADEQYELKRGEGIWQDVSQPA